MTTRQTPEILEEIRQFGTCTIANAIEKFNVRTRNEGFTDSRIHSMFGQRPAMIGYAVTGSGGDLDMAPAATETRRDISGSHGLVGSLFVSRLHLESSSCAGRRDPRPGRGAFWGEVHANIHLRLGCAVGAVTNGAVRDLDRIDKSGFQLFAGDVSVSHAYVHFVDFGSPIDVAGMKVFRGDLLLADRHGVLSIPKEIAADIPKVAAEIEKQKRHVVDYCTSKHFSVEGLKTLVVGNAGQLHEIE